MNWFSCWRVWLADRSQESLAKIKGYLSRDVARGTFPNERSDQLAHVSELPSTISAMHQQLRCEGDSTFAKAQAYREKRAGMTRSSLERRNQLGSARVILGNVGIAADRDDLPVGVLVRAPFLRCAAALTPATGLCDRPAVRDLMPFPCSISLPPCARRSVPFEAAAARPQSAQHVRTRDRHHCHIPDAGHQTTRSTSAPQ